MLQPVAEMLCRGFLLFLIPKTPDNMTLHLLDGPQENDISNENTTSNSIRVKIHIETYPFTAKPFQ